MRAGHELSPAALANREVPFTTALAWTGLADGTRERGLKVRCPACGDPAALRVYPDHGWCFAERKRFSAVTLLAAYWEMDPATAAGQALEKVGYQPPTLERLLQEAGQPPEPDRDDLAEALRIFCRRHPRWAAAQYDPAVSGLLAGCLGLLPAVRTEEQCARWLETCKAAMARMLRKHAGIT